jgi:hypothetical protein
LVMDYLPQKRRQTSKGWIIFDAQCCHHRGHNKDTRSRGNLLLADDGSIVVNCYNCGFKTRYKGSHISQKFEQWLGYLNVPREKIQEAKLQLLSMKINGNFPDEIEQPIFYKDDFSEVELPENAVPIESLLLDESSDSDFWSCLEYLNNRGPALSSSWDYHWSKSNKWDLNKRIIIPFRHKGNIVGWTARYAGTPPSGTPRYYNSDVPNGYLFNADVINKPKRKFVIIVEGPFDAITIDGVAALGSEMNKSQIMWLNSTDKEKIVLPDRQRKNQNLIDIALNNNWSVSFPDWEENIKDAADAQLRYGQLYTLASIIKFRTNSRLQIEIKRKMFRG